MCTLNFYRKRPRYLNVEGALDGTMNDPVQDTLVAEYVDLLSTLKWVILHVTLLEPINAPQNALTAMDLTLPIRWSA